MDEPFITRRRFPGLHVSAKAHQFLTDQTREGRPVSARTWKRMRMLEGLHQRWTLADVAEAMGTSPREGRRVGWRDLEHGVQAALTDDPGPTPPKRLDPRQHAAIVARVCGPPPPGAARWTIRVTTDEAKPRGIVADGGRETVRPGLAHHARTPWRTNNVGRPHAGR